MPSRDDESTPNFDFLNAKEQEEGAPEWAPSADSALDMLERPAGDDSESSESVLDEERKEPAKPDDSEPSVEPTAYEAPEEMDFSNLDETAHADADEVSHDEESAADAPDDAGPSSLTKRPTADETLHSIPEPSIPEFQPPGQLEPEEDAGEQPVADQFEPAPTAASATSKTASASRSKSTRKRSSSSRSKASGDISVGGFAITGPLAICLVSYAFTATLILLYILANRSTHQLESLPDRAPLSPDEFRFVPETAEVAPGHRLKLGDSARFGNVRIAPFKVTRGVVQLEHYSGRPGMKPPTAGEEVLKLWVTLTNESDDQRIAPFDRQLVYDRRVDDDYVAHSDQYVVPADQQGSAEPNVDMYDLSPTGEWDLVGQEFPVLNPGESVTTFLAAGPEELDRLTGSSVWRMLMRKGFHDATGHGVLTLIDVEFDAAQAQKDPAT